MNALTRKESFTPSGLQQQNNNFIMTPTIKSQPAVFFIFGGTANLNKRKITPAIYNLFVDNWLTKTFTIAGTGRCTLANSDFRKKLLDGINQFSREGKAKKVNGMNSQPVYFFMSENVNDPKIIKKFKQI